MKFLVDMPLSPKTVQFLKNMGQEAVGSVNLVWQNQKTGKFLIMQKRMI
jgi:predicted nuclease of predicted toxin-antitoxin system